MTEGIFRYCPRCGSEQTSSAYDESGMRFECTECGFVFYRNTATTASMILKCGNEFLFSVRGGEPAKGLLDFPGGFVDAGETVEEAFVREMDEELGWCPDSFQYAFSFPNIYKYQSITYHTSDIFYFVEVQNKPELVPQDDVQALRWMALNKVQDSDLAFDSMKMAVAQLTEIFDCG